METVSFSSPSDIFFTEYSDNPLASRLLPAYTETIIVHHIREDAMEEKKEKTAQEELLDMQKELLVHARIRTVVLIGLIAPVIVMLVWTILTGQTVRRMESSLDAASGQIETLMSEVSRASGQISTLSSSMSALSKAVDVDSLREITDSLKDALSSVSDAAHTLSKLDPEAVNTLLAQLDGEIDGLSGALETVSQLDPDAINNLLGRLDEVMATLDKLTGILDKFSSFKLFG